MPTETDAQNGRGMRIITGVIGVFFAIVYALIVFGQSALTFAYSQPYLLDNLTLLLIVLALLGLMLLARRRFATWARPGRWLLPAYFAALLLCQLMVVRKIWFYPGWDVQNVYEYAQQIAAGGVVNTDYFRLCPNNAPITVLLALPLWVAGKLSLAVPYAVLPYLGALLVNLACLLGVLCVCKLTLSRFARLGAAALATVWIAFSMTVTIPYTDAYAIVFPVLALYLSLCGLRPFVKWFLISLVCFLGASIKPTVLIIEIALLLLAALRALAQKPFGAGRWRRAGAVLLAVVLGAIPGKLWQDAATTYLAGSAQPQEQLSETHYLMLGMNGKTYGGHSPEDVAFSTSFATLAQRRQANLARAWERFSSRDVAQNMAFFGVKAYKAFSDGMLASNNSYLAMETPSRTDSLSALLRNLYSLKGQYHPLVTTFEQGVWLLILLLCLVAMLGRGRRNPAVTLLSLTLFGVAAYLLLFEVWPRYLFVYAPLFVVLAALGLERLALPPRRAPAGAHVA